jgi:hypothetical protein
MERIYEEGDFVMPLIERVEVKSLLYSALDIGYISQDSFNTCYEQAKITKALIGGFMQALRKQA